MLKKTVLGPKEEGQAREGSEGRKEGIVSSGHSK
jgi:hypothetical protein